MIGHVVCVMNDTLRLRGSENTPCIIVTNWPDFTYDDIGVWMLAYVLPRSVLIYQSFGRVLGSAFLEWADLLARIASKVGLSKTSRQG